MLGGQVLFLMLLWQSTWHLKLNVLELEEWEMGETSSHLVLPYAGTDLLSKTVCTSLVSSDSTQRVTCCETAPEFAYWDGRNFSLT